MSGATSASAAVRRLQEHCSLDYQQHLSMLMANAARCRALANTASDLEVRKALLEMAEDIDAAVPILEDEADRRDGSQSVR